MKILIIGSYKITLTRLAVLCAQNEQDCKWRVVCDSEQSRNLWKNVTVVDSVVPHQDFDGSNTDNLVIDNVEDWCFYQNNPDFLDRYDNLVVASVDPIKVIDKSFLGRFEQIIVSKTVGVEKLCQYHTLFVNAKCIEFKEFKIEATKLKKLEYLKIDSEGKLTYPLVPQTMTESKMEIDPEVQQVVKSLKNMQLNQPDDVSKTGNTLDVWVCIYSDDTTALSQFKVMIGNEIIKSMYHTVSFQDNTGSLLFYFQVRKDRQDLFTSLVMNSLRALRTSSLITKGCIFA
jgi:hypothetical protein